MLTASKVFRYFCMVCYLFEFLSYLFKDKDHQFENCLFKSLFYVRRNSIHQPNVFIGSHISFQLSKNSVEVVVQKSLLHIVFESLSFNLLFKLQKILAWFCVSPGPNKFYFSGLLCSAHPFLHVLWKLNGDSMSTSFFYRRHFVQKNSADETWKKSETPEEIQWKQKIGRHK